MLDNLTEKQRELLQKESKCDGCGKRYSSSYLRTHQRKYCAVFKKLNITGSTSPVGEPFESTTCMKSPNQPNKSSSRETDDTPLHLSPIAGPSQSRGTWRSQKGEKSNPDSMLPPLWEQICFYHMPDQVYHSVILWTTVLPGKWRAVFGKRPVQTWRPFSTV